MKWFDVSSGASSGGFFVGHHKSDLDILITVPTVFWSPRTGRATARSAMVAGEDLFQPGFLSGYVVREPRWLSFLLYPICVARIMNAMGWYPIAQGRRRYLLSHLIDVLENEGDLPLGEVLERPETHMPGARPDMRIRDVLGWNYRGALFTTCDFSVFKPALMDRLLQRHKQRIASSLPVFSDTLNNGGFVFISPHGGLSADGRMGAFKSGIPQILEGAQGEVVVIPSNITYDVMSRGRLSAFLTIGPSFQGSKDWPRDRLEQEIRRAIVGATTVTLGHLASYHLRQMALRGQCGVPEQEFQAEMYEQAKQMVQAGFLVDGRLLKPGSFDRRWHRYISYAIGRGLIQRGNGLLRFDPENVLGGSISTPAKVKPWVVCTNELEALIEIRGPALPAAPPGDSFKTSTGA